MFRKLSIDSSAHMYNSYAAEILKKYGERAVKVLKQIPVEYIRSNVGFIWNSIDEYTPELVSEIIDKENLLSDEKFNSLHRYCKLWEDLKQLGEPEKKKLQYKLNFFGNVQDVGFRGTAQSYAKILGLTGYAKNLWDGSVECVVQGPESRIKILKKLLKKDFQISKLEETKQRVKVVHKEFLTF